MARGTPAGLHRAIVDAALDGYCRVALDGRILEVNDAYCRMTGYAEVELLAMRVPDVDDTDTRAEVEARLGRIVGVGHERFDTIQRRKDGTRWHAEVSARYDPTDGGSIVAFLRELGDRPLDWVFRTAHQRPLERFFNQSPDGFYISTLDVPQEWNDGVDKEAVLDYIERHQRIADVNDAMLAQYGARRDALVGRPLTAFFEHDAVTGRRLRRQLFDEGRLQTETCERRDDGSAAWFEGDYLCLRDERQRIVGTFGTQRDISARKRAEEALRESEARLKETSDRLSSLFDAGRDAVVITDADTGIVVEVNEAAALLVGRAKSEIVGRPHADLHPPEGADQFLSRFEALAAGDGSFVEAEVLREDGRRVPVEISAKGITLADGRRVVMASFRDVTERRSLEQQLLQSQKMEAVGRLAGGVAHDFNNVLTAILVQVNLLGTVPGLDEAMVEGVREIGREAQRAADLTRQLLLFARRSELRTTRVDLATVLADLSRMLRRLIGEHVAFDVEAAPGLPAVEAERSMLEQVIVNLCVNARDAMPGGGRLEVRAAPSPPPAALRDRDRGEPWICVSVTDSGSGMDASTLQHAFEPFFTTKEPGQGTGLGLASVHAIVQQHRGHVEVESVVGRGSTFRVYLPGAGSLEATEPPPRAAEERGGRETILLVEDEPSVRAVVRRLLAKWGYEVVEAGNGAEALEAWGRHRDAIDLLYTDLVMPGGMNGLELARRLRAERPSLKVLISTAYSHALGQGGDDSIPGAVLVPKPFLQADLLAALRSLLDAR